MKYLQPRFTLPASHNTSQMTWDYTFLTEEEFKTKYGFPTSQKCFHCRQAYPIIEYVDAVGINAICNSCIG